MTDPAALLTGTPYTAYTYGYPHKTAYRPLTPPRLLADVWAEEPRNALCLYVHVPFCEQRCGFCNLFTTAWAGPDLYSLYLEAVHRQAVRVRAALEAAPGPVGFARTAIGGGTPTVLRPEELRRLLAAVAAIGCDPRQAAGSVEASPATVDPEKLAVLREAGLRRLSGRPCTNATCGCHIGYVHMNELDLYSVFGDGVLERIPGR